MVNRFFQFDGSIYVKLVEAIAQNLQVVLSVPNWTTYKESSNFLDLVVHTMLFEMSYLTTLPALENILQSMITIS